MTLVEVIASTAPEEHAEIFQKWAIKNMVAALVFLNQATFHRAYVDIFNRFVGTKAYFDKYEGSYEDLLKCIGDSDVLSDGRAGLFDTVCNHDVFYKLFLTYEERAYLLKLEEITLMKPKNFLAITSNFSSSTGLIGSLFYDEHNLRKLKELHRLEMNAMYLDDAFLKSR